MSDFVIKNPREYRILKALLSETYIWRKDLNDIAGANNSPQNIKDMRDRSELKIPCQRVVMPDRDNRRSNPGRYYLLNQDKPMARESIKRWENKKPRDE